MGSSLENNAVKLLKWAVECDEKQRYTEAKIYYQNGIQLLIDVMKDCSDPEKNRYFKSKIEIYMQRAEDLQRLIKNKKAKGVYNEQIKIEDNSTGHSYESVFGRFLDCDVTQVLVEDAYIRSFHQCQNLLKVCELLVKKCPNLKAVQLVTATDEKNCVEQKNNLQQLQSEMWKNGVKFTFQFSSTLHDRQIKLSNGWIIKIGRGLDYFKPYGSKFALGFHDLDLRPCHETTVDIIHEKNIRSTPS